MFFFFISLLIKKRFATFFITVKKEHCAMFFFFISLLIKKRFATFFYHSKKRTLRNVPFYYFIDKKNPFRNFFFYQRPKNMSGQRVRSGTRLTLTRPEYFGSTRRVTRSIRSDSELYS